VSEIHADIDALTEFHAALTRFRSAQLEIVERVNAEIEVTRARLEAAARLSDSEEETELARLSVYRIEAQASEFRVAAGRFRDLLEADVPRAEHELLGAIASLTRARGVSS
jgi:hypothetical protein